MCLFCAPDEPKAEANRNDWNREKVRKLLKFHGNQPEDRGLVIFT
jgi:hypothetical protein